MLAIHTPISIQQQPLGESTGVWVGLIRDRFPFGLGLNHREHDLGAGKGKWNFAHAVANNVADGHELFRSQQNYHVLDKHGRYRERQCQGVDQ